MSDGADDDDLDEILNGALQAFQNANDSKIVKLVEVDGTTDRTETPGRQSVCNSEHTAREIRCEEAALEDALNSLCHTESNQTGSQADHNILEDDLRLVEEFVRGLASTLGTSEDKSESGGPSGAPESAPVDDTRQPAERLVDSIVGSLLSEDVLQKPMMEMRSAYVKWLHENEATLSEEDLRKYTEQHRLVAEICNKYETKADSSEIMELLSKIHSTGEPPPEVVKSLDVKGEEGLPENQAVEMDKLAEQCGVQ